MGRCSGYRARNENREEVDALRRKLSGLRQKDWGKASIIMAEIARVLGHDKGPMGGAIVPRACRYCGYFGHTRQWCSVRMRREATELDEWVQREKEALGGEVTGRVNPEWLAWMDWVDRRSKAARCAGWGCWTVTRESAADVPCEACEGCKGWDRFMLAWENENPEPTCAATPQSAERGCAT